MQVGGKHYVSIDSRNITFNDYLGEKLLSIPKNDFRLTYLFEDTGNDFDSKRNYVGLIFWAKILVNKETGLPNKVLKNWTMPTNRHDGMARPGQEAFRTGTVLMRPINELSNPKSRSPHWILWEDFFKYNKEKQIYLDYVADNPETALLITGFSYTARGEKWSFRSALANSTAHFKHFDGDTKVEYMIKNVLADDTSKTDYKKFKEEDGELAETLEKEIKVLINNKGVYPIKGKIKWSRISPDHKTGNLDNGNVSELTDPFVINTLEEGYLKTKNLTNPPMPEVESKIQFEHGVYSNNRERFRIGNPHNKIDRGTIYLEPDTFKISDFYHKGTGSRNSDGHVYYFDYANMIQVDVWFEGQRQNGQVRISKLIRDPPFEEIQPKPLVQPSLSTIPSLSTKPSLTPNQIIGLLKDLIESSTNTKLKSIFESLRMNFNFFKYKYVNTEFFTNLERIVKSMGDISHRELIDIFSSFDNHDVLKNFNPDFISYLKKFINNLELFIESNRRPKIWLDPEPPMYTRKLLLENLPEQLYKDEFENMEPEVSFGGIILKYSDNQIYEPSYPPEKIKTKLYYDLNPGSTKHERNKKLLNKIAVTLSKVGTDYTIPLNVFESLLPYHNYYKSKNVLGFGEGWKKHSTNRQSSHTPIFSEEQIRMLFIIHGFKRSSDAWIRFGVSV